MKVFGMEMSVGIRLCGVTSPDHPLFIGFNDGATDPDNPRQGVCGTVAPRLEIVQG